VKAQTERAIELSKKKYTYDHHGNILMQNTKAHEKVPKPTAAPDFKETNTVVSEN
jgi:hypothetical protein